MPAGLDAMHAGLGVMPARLDAMHAELGVIPVAPWWRCPSGIKEGCDFSGIVPEKPHPG
jgi:hypothetical protein